MQNSHLGLDQRLVPHPECGNTWFRIRPILDGFMRARIMAFSEESYAWMDYEESIVDRRGSEDALVEFAKLLCLKLTRDRGPAVVDSESGWASWQDWLRSESLSVY